MAAYEDPLLGQFRPIGPNRHRHVDSALRVIEIRPHEEKDPIALAIPERMVQEQRSVIDLWMRTRERVSHLPNTAFSIGGAPSPTIRRAPSNTMTSVVAGAALDLVRIRAGRSQQQSDDSGGAVQF